MSEVRTLEASFALSGTTHIASFSASAMLSQPGQIASFAASGHLNHVRSFSAEALITDKSGTFRGTMLTAERDALPALQPQDTVLNIDATTAPNGVNVVQAQYWTGSAWLSGAAITSPVSGVTNLWTIPTTAGWRIEQGDPTYPIRYWNGTTTKFTVDNAGNVAISGSVTASSLVGGSIDIPSVGGTGFHVDSAGNFGVGGTTATNGRATIDASGAGVFKTVSVVAVDATSVPLSITNAPSTGESIVFYYDGTGARVGSIGLAGTTGASLTTYGAASGISIDSALAGGFGIARYEGDGIMLQDRVSGHVGITITASGDQVAQLAANSANRGAPLQFLNVLAGSGSAPATPSGTNLVLYDTGGVLKWKNSSGTVYDLSAFTTIATDTLWDALGDTVYGSGADTAAKLAGNTTTTKKYLSQTGNGSVSAAPAWAQVAFGDLSGSVASTQMPALTGDVTTSAGAVATTIANNAVTYAKMQDVSATSRFLGRITAGSGDPEELTAANAKTILALNFTDLAGTISSAQHSTITSGDEHSEYVKRVYSITSETSFSNTNAESTLATYTVPAASLAANTTYRIVAGGNTDNIATSGSFTWKLKLGSVTLASMLSSSNASSKSASPWNILGHFTCRTTGATGTVAGSAMGRFSGPTAINDTDTLASGTVDTTGTLALTLTITMATANASNVTRIETFDVVREN